jgi:hypothetical protein
MCHANAAAGTLQRRQHVPSARPATPLTQGRPGTGRTSRSGSSGTSPGWLPAAGSARTHPAVGCRWTVLRGSVLGGGSAISSVVTANQWLRCPATDPEGYRCVRFLSHQGAHQWRRCAWTDPEGYRCFLPPSHPGDHELAWFARPTPPGTTRTICYHGSLESAAAQADGDGPELAFHDWFPVSQTYVSGAWGTWAWVLACLTVVFLIGIVVLVYMRATTPAGELFVVYEYRPSTPARASAAVPAQVAPVGAVRPKDVTTTSP